VIDLAAGDTSVGSTPIKAEKHVKDFCVGSRFVHMQAILNAETCVSQTAAPTRVTLQVQRQDPVPAAFPEKRRNLARVDE
jgi:hypothetical protein